MNVGTCLPDDGLAGTLINRVNRRDRIAPWAFVMKPD
jgi:hypothetical protein